MATILIVDDHAQNLDFLRTLLGYSKHHVLEASDGAQALAIATTQPPDLIISDVLMPTMDGYEFVRRLRETPRLATVPVIFYTAHYREREAASLARACGVECVLLKPSEPDVILRAVGELLGHAVSAVAPAAEFDREHLRLVTDKLSHAADEAQWLAQRLEKLVEINLTLASERDPAALLRGFCSSARTFITARHAFVAVRKNGDATLRHVFVAGMDDAATEATEKAVMQAEPFREIFESAASIRHHNPSGDPRAVGLPEACAPVQSLLLAPIRSLTRTYGWACLTGKLGAEEFSAEDERLLTILAAQVGRIYENGSLYKEVRAYANDLEREVDARTKAQHRLNLQYGVARVLSDTLSFQEAAPRLLETICDATGFTAGTIWAVDPHAESLRCMDVWGKGNGALTAFSAETRGLQFRAGVGLPGRTWDTRSAVWIPDVLADATFQRAASAAAAGLRSAVAFPVASGGTVTGVIEFFGSDVSEPSAGQLDVFAALGSQIGQFIQRRHQQDRIGRLARIHAVLSGINSLIVRVQTREELYREACKISVEQGGFGIAWIGGYDPETTSVAPLAWAGDAAESIAATRAATHAGTPEGDGALGIAIHSKRAAFENDIVANPGAGAGRRQLAVQLGYQSLIVLPLVVDGEVKGHLSLFARERDFFNEEELRLLNELAGDIAFALDHISKREKLAHLAFFDGLTGLPNRALFIDRLGQHVETARETREHIALAVMNIDRFRHINGTLGRHAGDRLLKEVAARLAALPIGQTNIARVGADVFAVTLHGHWQPGDSPHLLDRAYEACFGMPFLSNGEELRISATVGIAVFPNDGDNPETLFANAEAALRKARVDRARFLFYAPDMNARAAESLRLESRLRRGIGRGELVLHYQPKVEVRSRRIAGLEALMRWQDTEQGLVPPGKFIPVMEQTGLILEASDWALRQALADADRWAAAGYEVPRIAVNVSALDLQQKNFVARIAAVVGHSAVNSGYLELEITESVIMNNIDATVQALKTVREMGVTIAVDDFGTGYSSLAYIAKLPITALKIDRAFISGMMTSADNLAIVRSIISLAHSLKLKVVAEGVETEEQAAQLWQLGCDQMQGYLVSRPVPFGEATALLSKSD